MESEGSDPGNSSGEGGCDGFLKLSYREFAALVRAMAGFSGLSLRGRIPSTHASHEFPESLLRKEPASPKFVCGAGASPSDS